MWKLPGIVWVGLGLINFFVGHAGAEENRYSAVFAMIEEEFEAMRDETDPTKIRSRHLENMKATGNFSMDPCTDFYEYSCGGLTKGVATDGMEATQYHHEIFKFQMKHVLLSEDGIFDGEFHQTVRVFFNSCLHFDGSQKIDDVVTKLFAVVDNAPDWTEAILHLRMYGVNVFFNISYDDAVKISTLPTPGIFDSLEDLSKILADYQLQDADEVAQKISQFRAALGHQDSSLGIKLRDVDLNKTFPALRLEEHLEVYAVSNTTVTILGQELLERLNGILASAERSTIDLFLKAVILDKVLEKFKYFSETETNRYGKCFEVAYEYLQPFLHELYARNFIPEEAKRSSSQILEAINESFKTEARGYGLHEFAGALDALKVLSLRTLRYSGSQNEYTTREYKNLNLEREKGFLYLYFNVVFIDNGQKNFCQIPLMDRQNPSDNGKLIADWRFKAIDFCKRIYGLDYRPIPLYYFTAPFYNIAYPDFWNFASLTWAYFWHVLKPVQEQLSKENLQLGLSETPFHRVWRIVGPAYRAILQRHGGGVSSGYEDLKLRGGQALFLAFVQNSCYLLEGTKNIHNIITYPYISDLFNCPKN